MDEFKAKFNDDFYTAPIYHAYATAGGGHGQGQVHRIR